MSFKTALRSLLPSALDRLLTSWRAEVRIQLTRLHYGRILRRIRGKVRRGEKIRVLFLESEIAKWKTQSLFARMKASPYYEPVMGISRQDGDEGKTSGEIQQGIDAAVAHFEALGNACVVVFDAPAGRFVELRRFAPDIVFYQETWYGLGEHHPLVVSRTALLAYVPYYVPNYGDLELDARQGLHRVVKWYFLLNQGWVDAFLARAPRAFYVGRLLPVGHTMLDVRPNPASTVPKRPCVIYAPHFSFDTPTRPAITKVSTFPWTGRPILDYARRHPEMDWVFKPHPVLYRHLIDAAGWTKGEVDRYYDAWADLGLVCTDDAYQAQFDRSTAMVTDCCSFLIEYGVTGKPIINLVAPDSAAHPMKPSRELFDTYYQVRNLDEMYRAFATVLEKGEDPKRPERLAAVAKAGLSGTCAAQNILDIFAAEFGLPAQN